MAFRMFISSFRPRRRRLRPKRNISDKYPFLRVGQVGREDQVGLVDHRCQVVRAGLWDLWDRVDQLRRLCQHRQGDLEGLGVQHRQRRLVLRVESVGFEREYRHRLVVHQYQRVRVVQVGLVVRVVQEEHRFLGGRAYLDLRGLRASREVRVDLVDLVGMVCMAPG